jgi:hypothetical protein
MGLPIHEAWLTKAQIENKVKTKAIIINTRHYQLSLTHTPLHPTIENVYTYTKCK